MRKILGLDLGTNSIGWSLIEFDAENQSGSIIDMGSRIIPMDSELLSNYETGQAASRNAARRQARSARRLRYRYKLRRQRLIETLKMLGWLPGDFQPGHQFVTPSETLVEMKKEFGSQDIPDDWTVYYLRHKALTERVSKEEIARILYHMNQRRGFKSSRKAPDAQLGIHSEEVTKREKTVEMVTVHSVTEMGEKKGANLVFEVALSDGRTGTVLRKIKPDWENLEIELEITTIPPTKSTGQRYEFRPLSRSDKDTWAKEKLARETAIERSGHIHPGNYYFHQLKSNPRYIIKDVSIDRRYYLNELSAILEAQFRLQPELNNDEVIRQIARHFYPKNDFKRKEIEQNDLRHLFINDIIYYQRPLKTKKSTISDCRFAKKVIKTDHGPIQLPYKAAPISSPIFQEFRIWQTLNSIRVIQRKLRDPRGRLVVEQDVSPDFLTVQVIEKLYELFDSTGAVTQKQILKLLGLSDSNYLINLFRMKEDKELPGNETKSLIRKQFRKAGLIEKCEDLLADWNKYSLLWHIFYSLDEPSYIESALKKHFKIPDEAARNIAQIPAFKSQYGSLSHQAMSRLLPLMRSGKYWDWNSIDQSTRQRLTKLINGEEDVEITDQVRRLFKENNINSEQQCQGFSVVLAAYAVFGIHNERHTQTFSSPGEMIPREPLNLRNPIVEQVVNETLRLVQDIWKRYGRPFEIHIELARDLKKNRQEREEISKKIQDGENENKRISAILRELKIGNPNSVGDIERMKLWEQQADAEAKDQFKQLKFKRPSEPTPAEIEKYRLWAQQRFLSPYSGRPIPLSKLFTREYDVDHIIPSSRYFDDSIENKVVVETALNTDKGNRTAYQYITSGSARGLPVLPVSDYEHHITQYYFGKKRKLLLSEDVPAGFASRQLVDSRYITRKLGELLGPVCENTTNPILFTTGRITSELKSKWGITETLKNLIKWRFERLQEKTQNELVSYEQILDEGGRPTGKEILRLEGFHKRLDHRHHALDAVVVACTTRAHIKYLNDLNKIQYKKEPSDPELEYYLPRLLKVDRNQQLVSRKFREPWPNFNRDVSSAMENIVVSFRKTVRVFGRKANKTLRYVEQPDGSFVKQYRPVLDENGKKKLFPYVRQSLHKPTIWGKITLREYRGVSIAQAIKSPELIANKTQKIYIKQLLQQVGGNTQKALKLYKANPLRDTGGAAILSLQIIEFNDYSVNRVDIVSGFDRKRLEKIPDPPLRRQLVSHIEFIEGLNAERPRDEQIDPFGSEGIDLLNKNRKIPVRKVRTKEDMGSKFEVRRGAYSEADKGTNLFFVIYQNLSDPLNRKYESIPLRAVVEAQSNGSGFVEEIEGFFWFTLSPNELVYLPDDGENIFNTDWNERSLLSRKIYKFVSSTKTEAYFVPHTVSKCIQDKVEFDNLNKTQRSIDGRMIKQHCIKLEISRLGEIRPASHELRRRELKSESLLRGVSPSFIEDVKQQLEPLSKTENKPATASE
ncbi:MAG TPA: HNH endonuclease domain-containing protein [Chitinophagaceae bacterium]|nr:HNH endonuclease domain-containing protein [Chitinophagaceae bacterium]